MNLYINYFLHAVKNTFNYKGRARRKEYWSIVFIYVILYLMLMLAGGSYTLLLLIGGLILITIPIAISVTVRRLHDINKSGWWILGAMIPIFGIIIGFIDSYPQANKWGENPKEEILSITENDRKKAMKITGGILGITLLVFVISLLPSLFTSYKCDSSDAKEMILQEFEEKIKSSDWIESQFYYAHINAEDIRGYSYANGLNYYDVLAQEQEKLASKLANFKEKIVESIKLENILTHKIDKDIKKCECEATITDGEKEQKIQYSVQENSEGEINVKLYTNYGVDFLYPLKNITTTEEQVNNSANIDDTQTDNSQEGDYQWPPKSNSTPEFDEFFKKFNSDNSFQISRIVFPIKKTINDMGDISHETITKDKWEVETIDEKSDYYYVTKNVKGNKATIYLSGNENGISMQYHFEKRNGEWYLVSFEDASS